MGANLGSIKYQEIDNDSLGDQTKRCKEPNLNWAVRSRLNELKAESKVPRSPESIPTNICSKSGNVLPNNKSISDHNYRIKLSEFMLLYKGTIVSKYNAMFILTPESSSTLKKPNITWEAYSIQAKDTIVVKTIQLDISYSVNQENYISKLKLLRNLDSPFLPRIYEFYIENNLLHICMERYNAENLYDYITRKGPLNPAKISKIMFQLAFLLKSLHKDNILMQTLNPNDILLIKYQKKLLIKVTSIENIVKFKKTQKSRRVTDFKSFMTGEYISTTPAIRKACTNQVSRNTKSYNNKVDIWCLGKILYHMICGFNKGRITISAEIWKKVTRNGLNYITEQVEKYREFIELLQYMLNIDASKRFSAKRCLNIPLIKQGISTGELDIPDLNKKIRRFRKYNLIQQISFMYCAKFLLSYEQVYLFTLSYIQYSTVINTSENRKHHKNMNVTYTEFVAASCNWKSTMNKEMLDQMYISINSTGKGIQPLSLQKYLKNKDSCGKIVDAFKQLKCEVGCIQDYHISKEEYINIVLERI